MVRGPAALLGLLGAAFAYFLVAPSLPELRPPELSALVASALGLGFVVAIVAGLVAVADTPAALGMALLGAVLLVAPLDAFGAASAATPFEAVLFGCAGVAFAVVLDTPWLAVALPLFAGVVDVAQALAGGPAGIVALSTPRPGDALALDLPDWGTGLAAARLSVPEVVLVAAFAAYARRFGLRERAAELGMLAGLLVAAGAEILLDVQLPAVALLAAGCLVPNADRVRHLFAAVREG
ncbi:MAG: hypothetical protein QOG35_2095 [Solirubrobacteraceae bacterium]|nr:hypothetical protein [Solirubrobacteraceae bacterium]